MFNRELIVLTTYFNPCGYQTRRTNYDEFVKRLKINGVQCITIECAFNDQPFELPDSLDVLRVRTDSILWQKERLLNLAVKTLPTHYKYVAWLDCDIVFQNPNWVGDCVDALKQHKVVQVFETCKRLDQSGLGEADPIAPSFGLIQSLMPVSLECGRYDVHGHTGYGWAMHRSIFDEVGLYESAISGSADHFMAHAIYNHYGFCVENALKHDAVQIKHLKEWGDQFYDMVKGSFGFVPGQIHHLWHGSTENRRYFLRMHEITDLGYNPYQDIISKPGLPLEWSPAMNKSGLKDYFINYFISRQEDGEMCGI
jgi:hypothetical protein